MRLKMKHIIVGIFILLFLPACSSNSFWFKDKEKIVQKTEQADQTVNLALAYFDQGDFQKSGDLFIEAADLYTEVENNSMAGQALIASAKSYLKCSRIPEFHLVVARLKGLEESRQMPETDVQFLVNLSEKMQQKPLSYPVQKSWRDVFGY